MATRKIKDAKDLSTNELIYFKSHAKATYLSDGRTVEDAIAGLGGTSSIYVWNWDGESESGTITDEEFDAMFNASVVVLGALGNIATIKLPFSDTELVLASTTGLIGSGITNINITLFKTEHRYTAQFESVPSVFKTINGQSISGSGNINVGYKPVQTTTATNISLTPNIYYRHTGTPTILTIKFATASDSTIMNEYFIEFTTASSGTTIGLPMNIKWANGVTPTFENGTTYQLSFVNNLGVCTKFSL